MDSQRLSQLALRTRAGAVDRRHRTAVLHADQGAADRLARSQSADRALTLLLFGQTLNLYSFVGIIMLIGIVKKNAIMMIDFALVDRRENGSSARDAIYNACLIRFRPIMMTTMAALAGTLPIAVGYGDGGEARAPLGLAVVGGLVVSQFITLYLTPVVFVYMDRLQGRMWGSEHARAAVAAGE